MRPPLRVAVDEVSFVSRDCHDGGRGRARRHDEGASVSVMMDVLGMGAPIVPVAPFIAAPFVFVVDAVGTGAPVFPVVVVVVFVVAVLGEWVVGLEYLPLDLFLFFCCRSMASVLFAQCAASHSSRSNTFSSSSQSSSSLSS